MTYVVRSFVHSFIRLSFFSVRSFVCLLPGVIVDLAALGGGNCEITKKDQRYVTDNGLLNELVFYKARTDKF